MKTVEHWIGGATTRWPDPQDSVHHRAHLHFPTAV